MGDEADADWQDGLIEWGAEDFEARLAGERYAAAMKRSYARERSRAKRIAALKTAEGKP